MFRAHRSLRSGYAGKQAHERKQTIRTPPEILAPVIAGFGSRVQLDPCASRWKRHHFAEHNYTYKGLERPWMDRTYVNPPFDSLGDWLEHARAQARKGFRIALIGPWRSHRVRFCAPLCAAASLVYLKAFPFLGQENCTPFPCFIAGYNIDLPSFGALELGRGEVLPPKLQLVHSPSSLPLVGASGGGGRAPGGRE